MASRAPARPPTLRLPRTIVLGLLVVVVAIAVALGPRLIPSPSTSSTTVSSSSSSSVAPWSSVAAPPAEAPHGGPRGPLGEADGAVPDGTTVFDDGVPGVANLDPVLLGALREAATEAAGDGVELVVNSGWRSPAYQEELLQEAIAEHGSEEEAARWVATAETSAHVSGDAVDIGPAEAAAWLAEHGADHGLCPIYDNEPWHFELRPEAVGGDCPARFADPTEDPRMQR
jgi:D-alanyl-D-alanine carboxypeptidase